MRIHFIAIGGSAMHNLAIVLHLKGHRITGSDDIIRNPSRDRLKRHGLLPEQEGWHPERITTDLDMVILGMHAREDNPELLRAQELGVKILSYPEFIYRQSKDKKRIVIAGSHGKTTITSILLHALRKNGIKTDYMVGALLEGFDNMVELTDDNPYIVLEGDEYLSSPIDRRSKFLHYHPDILLISGIAWDHINVFPTREAYISTFRQLIGQLTSGAYLIYNEEDPILSEPAKQAPDGVHKIPYRTPEYRFIDGEARLLARQYPVRIFGAHNFSNIMGALSVAKVLGIGEKDFFDSIAGFKGASRRLEILAESDKAVLIRDFAHAPSKVKGSLSAVREKYPGSPILAVLELHTFSSLNKDFLDEYKNTLDLADQAVVFYQPRVIEHKKLPPVSPGDVKKAFDNENLIVLNDTEELRKLLYRKSPDKRIVLMMSSGTFDGLDWEELIQFFE